ncbi:sugar-binding transcriptional regulator [bacterium]|nr:sugar-binding transcriptional regulator [bacterium]
MNSYPDTTALLVETARLYYEQNLSQQQIADRLGISRPMVSRFLSRGRKDGIIRIQIVDPDESSRSLGQRLRERYGLKDAVVVRAGEMSESELKTALGEAAASYLGCIIQHISILGVSWGTTMQAVADSIRGANNQGLQVVQLVGGFTGGACNTHAGEITQRIATRLGTTACLLPLPAIVDSAEVKQALLSDRNIARVVDLARKSDAALFSLGTFTSESILVQAQYFGSRDVQALRAAGAVGDICTHLVTADGSVCSPALEERTLGIGLDDLKEKRYSIAVAGGSEKGEIILAGLRGGYFNVLVTDDSTAAVLLS